MRISRTRVNMNFVAANTVRAHRAQRIPTVSGRLGRSLTAVTVRIAAFSIQSDVGNT
jgi:hypothetical protein